MPTPSTLLAFTLACVLLALIPGPSLLFTLGRALAAGRAVAVRAVAGNAAGLFAQAVVVALGLGPLLAASELAFTVMKVVGAAYLLWLAVQTWRTRGDLELTEAAATPVPPVPSVSSERRRALTSGFIVGVTNPKVLAFLVALLPQFVDPARGPAATQLLVLAVVLTAVIFLNDLTVALAASRARAWLTTSPVRVRRLTGVGAALMGGLGIGLLFTGHTRS